MSLTQVVTVVGIIAGVVLIATAVRVFWRQTEAPAGTVAAIVGLVLIGMSQWSNIRIKGAGLEIDINALAQAVDQVAEEAVTTAAAVQTTREQLLTLSNQLEGRQVITAPAARALRDSLSSVESIDTAALKRAREELRTAIRPGSRLNWR